MRGIVFVITGVWCLCLTDASDSVDQCSQTYYITKIISKSVTYRCGWCGWWRCTRTRYYTSHHTIELCCKGYEKVNGKCISTTKSLACGRPTYQSGISPFIVGGSGADYGEYPWLVSLTKDDHFCAGTIIGDRWILTAAHCLVDRLFGTILTNYSIRVGEHDRRTTDPREGVYRVEDQFVHEGFSRRTNANDVALIRTSREIPFDDYVKPICLPNAGQRSAVGTEMEIAGWGRMRTDGPDADILQKAIVQTGSNADCVKVYGGNFDETRQLCIEDGQGNVERGACRGDSGGPLMLRDRDVITCVGITSYVIQKGCAAGYPVVYTAVAEYVTWIKSIMRENTETTFA